jgi:hypothetical protein
MLSDERFRGFKDNPRIEGTHAFLSPSSPSWLRYPEDKLIARLKTAQLAEKGTRLHAIAAANIEEGIELKPDGKYPMLAAYVNDAIEFNMAVEQPLFFSFNCFGTADAICFENNFLRIHDLKTGVTKASLDQLYVYAGIFCHEYGFKPFEIDGELRIYQGLESTGYEIDRVYLAFVYDKIRASHEAIELHNERLRGGLA